MNCVYMFMCGITEKVTFPIPLDMEKQGCTLFDIRGKVKPFTNEPLFSVHRFYQVEYGWK